MEALSFTTTSAFAADTHVDHQVAGNALAAVSLTLEGNGHRALVVIIGDEEQIVNFVMIEIVVFADLVRAAGAVIVERALAGGRAGW